MSTDPQHEPPPAGEEVHLPGPTIIPLLTALGIAVALVGGRRLVLRVGAHEM